MKSTLHDVQGQEIKVDRVVKVEMKLGDLPARTTNLIVVQGPMKPIIGMSYFNKVGSVSVGGVPLNVVGQINTDLRELISYGKDLTREEKVLMKKEEDEGNWKAFDGLGCCGGPPMKFELKPDVGPVATKMKKFHAKIPLGVIEQSTSPWSSQVHLKINKSSSIRKVVSH
eukprot:GHVP01069804.1.p1 GENE.GHVP01069804.1~~GHVP01069804.1.p1  ORF type:complete len:170 (+),score=20.31 GHVP01069804.1:1315-1824(+)